MKKLIEIDEELFKAIKKNSQKMNNSMNKEIEEMLWLALQPRTKQIKKVEAIRTSTIDQLKNKRKKRKKQAKKRYDYEKAPKDSITNEIIIDDIEL